MELAKLLSILTFKICSFWIKRETVSSKLYLLHPKKCNLLVSPIKHLIKSLERVLSNKGAICKIYLEIKFNSFENEISFRKFISCVIGGMTKGKVTS